jgi:GTP pyrophosphokinase/guanosine-3',5'-bis(diphosphate) 3'-pyrophosphohydrolase
LGRCFYNFHTIVWNAFYSCKNTCPITLELTISNDAGVLGRVCTIVGDLGANISDMEFLDRKLDFFKLILTIDLRDVEHLHAILSRLDGEHAVATVSRTRRIGNQSD